MVSFFETQGSLNAPGSPGLLRILLVDDDAIICEGVSKMLSSLGHQCATRFNGKEAYELLQHSSDFDLIITDLRMPIMGGVELVRLIREKDTEVPIIIMTADVDRESAVQCLRYGANDFIEKPFDPLTMLKTVENRRKQINRKIQDHENKIVSNLLLLVSDQASKSQTPIDVRCRQIVESLATFFECEEVNLFLADEQVGALKLCGSTHLPKSDKWVTQTSEINDSSQLVDTLKKMFGVSVGPNDLVAKVEDAGKWIGILHVGCSGRALPYNSEKKQLFSRIAKSIGFVLTTIQVVGALGQTNDAAENFEAASRNLLRMAMFGDFAISIVHEISNPLTVTSIYVKKLLALEGIDPTTQLYLQKVASCTNAIEKIVFSARNQFLQGKETAPEVVNLRLLADSAMLHVENKLVASKVKPTVLCSPRYEIKCVRHQIEQVIVNLVSNAIDAVQSLADRSIELKVEMKGDKIACFEISNPGQPIPEDIQARMFDRFFTTKSLQKGTGLGLFICKSIVKKHGGTIRFYRDDRERNTFSFEINSDAIEGEST